MITLEDSNIDNSAVVVHKAVGDNAVHSLDCSTLALGKADTKMPV